MRVSRTLIYHQQDILKNLLCKKCKEKMREIHNRGEGFKITNMCDSCRKKYDEKFRTGGCVLGIETAPYSSSSQGTMIRVEGKVVARSDSEECLFTHEKGHKKTEPKIFPEGRICAVPDCGTELNPYNGTDYCDQHWYLRKD